MLALLWNLSGKRVVVVGGGPVGRRKARKAAEAGAIVEVIALEPKPNDWPSDIQWTRASFHSSHLIDATLVFAAAPREVNEEVVRTARQFRIPVNRADNHLEGDFVIPAQERRDGLILSVGTIGGAPTLSRRICRRALAGLDPVLLRHAALIAELRQLMFRRVTEPGTIREILQRWSSESMTERIRNLGEDRVRTECLAELDDLTSASSAPQSQSRASDPIPSDGPSPAPS